jgi:hypothetical protein
MIFPSTHPPPPPQKRVNDCITCRDAGHDVTRYDNNWKLVVCDAYKRRLILLPISNI